MDSFVFEDSYLESGTHDIRIQFKAIYEEHGGQHYAVTFRFDGVRLLAMPEVTPVFWMDEVEVEDLSKDQMEGIGFRWKDYQTGFEIVCEKISIVGFERAT